MKEYLILFVILFMGVNGENNSTITGDRFTEDTEAILFMSGLASIIILGLTCISCYTCYSYYKTKCKN